LILASFGGEPLGYLFILEVPLEVVIGLVVAAHIARASLIAIKANFRIFESHRFCAFGQDSP
jgi:hypothetical protein